MTKPPARVKLTASELEEKKLHHVDHNIATYYDILIYPFVKEYVFHGRTRTIFAKDPISISILAESRKQAIGRIHHYIGGGTNARFADSL